MTTGILFEEEQAGMPPPLEEGEEEEKEVKLGRPLEIAREGGVPLHPAAVRLPASLSGRLASELTGYPGFAFTEQELNDLGELWIQCGVQASPLIQAISATIAMLMIKGLGFTAWQKAGRPGDLKQPATGASK